ncbi:hypothetical protein RND81_12G077100 [Saponaria officinalis]|uniref:DUF7746 domain-containing protein n=1 Tax=Saponaria officinalis TaxID=3572 RepID=A0AAW1H7T3_SAPOF
MYSTICKSSRNTDVNIAKMIAADFTGQLKGWWDNYLSESGKETILKSVKIENGEQKENAVYTLAINIVEHFTRKYSDNHENIRTLLQNLRCKTLTDFRWYKDTFLGRVMELPETNSTHWKAKFIDGLPHLFAKRVKKSLRGNNVSIPYDQYTYGKLIGTCTQEGLNLCNEIKLNQKLKRQNLVEKHQLGEFCGQFGMDMPSTSYSHKKKKYSDDSYPNYKRKKRHYSQKILDQKNERKADRKALKKHYKKK